VWPPLLLLLTLARGSLLLLSAFAPRRVPRFLFFLCYFYCCRNSPRGSSRTSGSGPPRLFLLYLSRTRFPSEQARVRLRFPVVASRLVVLAAGLAGSRLGFRSPGMDSSGDGGAAPPTAVGGGSGAVASGSGGKPPVKRVMKTPYQLEVLERTYSGSWISADDSASFFVRIAYVIFLDLVSAGVLMQRNHIRTRGSAQSCLCSWD
jgi:hypothetical protein